MRNIKFHATTKVLFVVIVLFTSVASWRLWKNYSADLDAREVLNLSLELGLERHVSSHIFANVPDATGLEFYTLQSEVIDSATAKIVFDYKFETPVLDDSTSVRLKGWVMLSKTSGIVGKPTWRLGKLNFTDELIEYSKGASVISSL